MPMILSPVLKISRPLVSGVLSAASLHYHMIFNSVSCLLSLYDACLTQTSPACNSRPCHLVHRVNQYHIFKSYFFLNLSKIFQIKFPIFLLPFWITIHNKQWPDCPDFSGNNVASRWPLPWNRQKAQVWNCTSTAAQPPAGSHYTGFSSTFK